MGSEARDDAIRRLQGKGFTLLESWNWLPPPGKQPTMEDNADIHCLSTVWGYGGIVWVKRCPFCNGECDPRAVCGPTCRECDASVPTLTAWQKRVG